MFWGQGLEKRLTIGYLDQDFNIIRAQFVVLVAEEGPDLDLARLGFGERDILSSNEAAAGGIVDIPWHIGRRQNEHPGWIATIAATTSTTLATTPSGGFLQIAPLDQKLRLAPAAGLVLAPAGSAPAPKKTVDLIDKDDAGCHPPRDGKERPNQLLALAVPLARQAAGADGEEGRFGLGRDARASIVLPVPGGPKRSMPRAGSRRPMNRSGRRKG